MKSYQTSFDFGRQSPVLVAQSHGVPTRIVNAFPRRSGGGFGCGAFQIHSGAVAGAVLAVGIAIGHSTGGAAEPSIRIGKEALVALPDAALWSAMVNFRPGDGEVVALNPPPFSWLYKDDDPNSTRDQDSRVFQFQVAHDMDFKELAVNVRTESNMYNFIAPFSKKQCWWRVGYIYPKKGAGVDHWSAVRTFTIADNSVEWDRAMLADEQYLISKEHPRLLFNRDNRLSFSKHVQANELKVWKEILGTADLAILSDWWKAGDVEQKSGSGRLRNLWAVAFVWQMTKDPKYLDANPQDLLVKAAKSFVDSGAAFVDMVSGGFWGVQFLAQAYDWLYEAMTPEQRQATATSIGTHCKYVIFASTFHFPIDRKLDAPAQGIYPEYNRRNGRGTIDNYSESHQWDNLGYSIVAAIAAYSEDKWARQLLDLSLNTVIGRPYYAGNEEGMNAGGYSFSDVARAFERSLMCQFTFPEVNFNRQPFFTGIADWFSRIKPVGAEAEMYPWGDTNNQMYTPFTWWSKYLSWYVGDGRVLKQWREEMKRLSMEPYRITSATQAACSFYLKEPEMEEERIPVAKVFPLGGWAMSAGAPTNTPEAFCEGLGFIFCCRPSGTPSSGHDAAVDLSFELWAYGQTITENGCGYWAYNKLPESHNSIMVDGVGPAPGLQTHPSQGKIVAFSHTPQYTYCAGDGQFLYPKATANNIKMVRRHLLMVRNRFFVIFDDLETLNPVRYSWIYHILEDNLKLDPAKSGAFSYQRTKSSVTLNKGYVYQSKPVSVYVSHTANPAELEMLDLSGDMRTTNPITAKSYPVSGRPDYRTHALWVSNKTPTTKFHFMTVIYPVKEGGVAPTITRLDNFTAEVTCGAEKDVISFDPKTRFPATVVVDLFGIPVPTNPGASGPGIRPTP